MRPLDAFRWGRRVPALAFALALAWFALTARADDLATPSTTPPALESAATTAVRLPDGPDAALAKALQFERQHHWSDAIQVYQSALESAPDRVDLRHRLRLCESHFKLNRRYQDKSFREVLLKLSREQTLALYDEVIERIQLHYVEPVGLETGLRRGFDNMEVALRDPVFLKANAPNISADRIQWLRSNLQSRRQQVLARDRAEAKAQVLAVCEQGRLAANLAPTAMILEFTYGACDALDDYSSYLTPDRLDDLYAMIDGDFVGLGVELKLDTEGLKLVGVLKGGPAAKAELKVGDRITHIDGVAVRGLDLDAAANRLQGAEGSTVLITILRVDGSSVTMTLVRRHVEVMSVAEARIVDPEAGIGYIQLTGFQKTSTEEIKKAVVALQAQGMKQLVLDLRGNPGGLLNVAVEIADRFLDQGVIVSTQGRSLGQSAVYRAHADNAWTMPVFVLVDHDSASASEILAGALQENKRAIVLGDRSYGKGSVQSIFPLRSAPAGLKLTTAKFFSPKGRAYSEQGVMPDHRVATAARPAHGDRSTLDFPLGDPERDPVLRAAVRLAKNQ